MNNIKTLIFISIFIFSCFVMSSNICWGGVTIDKSFLSSKIGTSEVTVEEFVEILKHVRISNGKHPKMSGWSHSDNVYTLKVYLPEETVFKFEHLLNYNGVSSTLHASVNGKSVNAKEIFRSIVSTPRDTTKFDKLRQSQLEKQQREYAEAEAIRLQQRQMALDQAEKEARLREEQEIRKYSDENLKRQQKAIDSMKGFFENVQNRHWDVNSHPDDDILESYIDINVISNRHAEIKFISKHNNVTVCSIIDNNAIVDTEESTIISKGYGCDIMIEPDMSEGIYLKYRGDCKKQCPPSNITKMFDNMVYPTGAYVNSKKKQEAAESERLKEIDSWK